MKIKYFAALAAASVLGVTALTSCSDSANVTDSVEGATEAVEGAADKAGEAIDGAAEKTGEAVDGAVDAVKDAADPCAGRAV